MKLRALYKKPIGSYIVHIFMVSLTILLLSGYYVFSHPTKHLKNEDFLRQCNETKCEVVFVAGKCFAKFANESYAKFSDEMCSDEQIMYLMPNIINSTIDTSFYTAILDCERTEFLTPRIVCKNAELHDYYVLSFMSIFILAFSLPAFIVSALFCVAEYCRLKPVKLGDNTEYV